MLNYQETNAEVYVTPRQKGWSRSRMTYRRFPTLAHAIASVCEDDAVDLNLITIRTDSADIHGAAIRQCYEAHDFPLPLCHGDES